ncbi:tetratricopeptide repeat-containing diguanylate cyclase [Indiicoccus explosivorum]|uniref:tetratricopeptide repeat-containing diguanylate cyclase n=1 Tax=Indiicoccus explosivorum TaxID=1917864 RepID=UPI000B4366CE|nr:tetratricopeptide repeat-containing diguanylate cyclase [Indiicoccus explosivorum]
MTEESLLKLRQSVTRLRAEGKYKEAIERSYELLELGMAANDHKSILVAHLNSAASYYYIGEAEEAFRNIEAYREICIRYGTEEDYLQLYNILFLLHEYNKNYDKAEESLHKSIEIGRQLKKYNILSNSYSNFAHLLMGKGEFEQALEMGKRGLRAAQRHEPASRILEYRVKLNITRAYIELGQFHKSWPHIEEMTSDPLLDSFDREKAQSRDLLGLWYARQDKHAEALAAYTEAKEIVESYGDDYMLKSIQEARISLCEALGDITLAYSVQKEYIRLLNEISRRELSLVAMKLQLKHSIEEIERQANTDHLTGLYNRSYLEVTADRWLAEAAEKGWSVVCIAFDIDNFKQINDDYGHLFGDEAIRQVSEACAGAFRKQDLIGRYGGDEFVVVLQDMPFEAGLQKAQQLAETLQHLRVERAGSAASVTASIGVADNDGGRIRTFNELFHNADMALYQAKGDGKNRVVASG